MARDVKPALDDAGIVLRAVGIGTVERANEFCNHVGFPREALFADPENAGYSALGLKTGVVKTFFNEATPYAILDRVKKDGAKDLVDALGRWKPWIPPKLEQGLQQGGTFVFQGDQECFGHFDPSTGAHADLNTVLNVALSSVAVEDLQPAQ